MSIIKSIYKIFNGTSWDDHYFKTSSDQVIHTKADGTATTVQDELLAQNSAMLQKVGNNTTPGYFPVYNDAAHNAGLSYVALVNSTIARVVIDENPLDLVPNNKRVNGNYKIMDVVPSIVNGTWRITFSIYVDGKIYEKYINLS